MSGRLRRISAGSAGILDAARCHGCGHLARIHNAVGCVSGPCECIVTRADLMPNVPRLEIPDGVESTPAAPPAEPTPPPVAAAPVPAAPPAVPTPVGPEAAKPANGHVVAPVAAASRSVPTVAMVAPLDDHEVEKIIAARKRPRLHARPAAPSALGSAVVLGEPDAGGEVAAAGPGATGEAAATLPAWDPPKLPAPRTPPSPIDFGPLLAAALWVSARWYCPACHQWPLDPGACPGCRRPLQAVHNVTIPRETS
jgi:hypothetical protein